MTVLYMMFSVLAGICFAVQGPTNSTLGNKTNKLQAALISFGGGVLFLLLLVISAGNGNLGNIRNAEPWKLFGGIYGAYGVWVTIVAIPELGLALTLTVIMLGQLLMGTVIDMFGLFESSKVVVTPLRLLGITVVVLGIIAVYTARKETDRRADRSKAPIMVILALICGFSGAVQSPTNAALAKITGSFESTLVSFIGGFVSILIMNIIVNKGKMVPLRGSGVRPWMMVGGIYGCIGVLINIICTPVLGVALLVTAGMVGQLAGGLAVDSFGLLGTTKIPLDKNRAVGIALIAAGMIVVSISKMTV